MLAYKFLSRIPPAFANNIIQKTNWVKLAHHGLQRSGTNYLASCLWRCGVRPINSFDEDRASPRHKHCRWYADKSVIPSFIRSQYHNLFFVDSIEALNAAARYPEKTSHLVILKERDSWLASIMNWGLTCKWFHDKDDALNNLVPLAEDYDHYCAFWNNLANKDMNKVAIIRFERLRKDFGLLDLKLKKIDVEINCRSFDGKLVEVPMSKVGRPKVISVGDVRAVIASL